MCSDHKVASGPPVRSRSFALRFGSDVPLEIVEGSVKKANRLLTERFRGTQAFSVALKDEVRGGRRVLASYLHADERGWQAFQGRGEAFEPEAPAPLSRLVAWPIAIDDDGDRAVAAVG